MDKRSILFVVCVSLAFFGLHSGFDWWRAREKQAYEQAAQLQNLEKKQALERDRVARTAVATDFTLVDLYKDPLGREKAGQGIRVGKHVVAIAWEAKIPSKLYLASGNTFEVVNLTAQPAKANDPVFFAAESAKALELPALPVDQPTDLQLVVLNDGIQVTLGEQRGNDCALPYAYVDGTALAFVRTADGYQPVGVYDPSARRVKRFGDYEKLKMVVQQPSVQLAQTRDRSETFYVIENEYQQLVFTTQGGSLAEINLPLQTSKDSKSIVKEINADRQILAQSPQNAHFPVYPYHAMVGGNEVNQNEGSLGGYYPLLRRPIFNADGTQRTSVPAQFYALNIVSEVGDLANASYRVVDFGPNRIQFETSTGSRRIVKTYTIPAERNGPYCFELEIRVDGDASGLWLTSGIPDAELVGGSYAPQLKYQVKKPNGAEVDEISLPDEKGKTELGINPFWVSNCNGFLGLIVDPLDPIGEGYRVEKVDGNLVPTRLSLIDSAYQMYPPAKYPAYATLLPLKTGTMKFRVFAGPYDDSLLKKLDDLYEDPSKNYNPEYNLAISIQGWLSFISQPFAKFLFFLMQLFFAITRSWAASIILLTIALRAMMYPLNNWSIRSTLKMQELAPRLKAIQERNKKDPRKVQMETMNLYREAGVNPFSGCLPMLLQMPFLIGMFYMLKSSFPLRGAPFIPGWIDDLAAPDVLFSWGQPIWLIGNEFHLLPILTGLVMYIQGKMTQKTPKDPSQLTDAEKQQKMMGPMMAILFTVMFYSFPSGLNIYFMFSTLLGIVQQKMLMAKVQAKAN